MVFMIRAVLALLFLTLLGCENSTGVEGTVAVDEQDEFAKARGEMVERQIRARGIRNKAVLDAMRKVPRHRFVPEPQQKNAYADTALPIGLGQTISQPYIVAYMTEAASIKRHHKVLEIGTGSGYQAAVLGEIAKEVYTIEIVPELAERSAKVLSELGYKNISVRHGNGYLGWRENAPFDAILVTAAPEEVPQALVDQLAVGGKMVVPVGRGEQEMVIIKKTKEGATERRTIAVRFVPMTGKPSN